MNKKFSTLMMAGMLVAGPSLVSAQVTADGAFKLNGNPLKRATFETAHDKSNNGNYVIIIDNNDDGFITTEDWVLTGKKNLDGTLSYGAQQLTSGDNTVDQDQALWYLEEKDYGNLPGVTAAHAYYYALKNVHTNVYLSVKYTDSPKALTVLTGKGESLNKAAQPNDKGVGSLFTTQDGNNAAAVKITQSSILYYYEPKNQPTGGVANGFAPNDDDFEFSGGKKLIFCEYDERTVSTVDELNDIKGGRGFQFDLTGTDADDKVIDNIFYNQDLRAFNVNEITWKANSQDYKIPAGIYLASDWSELEKTAEGRDILADNTIDALEDFKKLTWVAVQPQEYTKVAPTDGERKNGVGFALTAEATWEDMNFYATAEDNVNYDATQLSANDKIFVNNACFTVTEKDPLGAKSDYTLTLNNVRLNTAASTKGAHTTVKEIAVCLLSNTDYVEEDDNATTAYLMTGAKDKAIPVTAVPSTTIGEATDLLNKDATPAVYAIKFVSGAEKEDGVTSEYGQYLTMRGVSGSGFQPTTLSQANVEDPLFQFVVSGVKDADKDDKFETVVLTNRLTSTSISFVLYQDPEDKDANIYTIYPANGSGVQNIAFAKAENNEIEFEEVNSKGMKVQFIEKDGIDKFSTFETRENDLGLVYFKLAKTAESEDFLYVAGERDEDDSDNDGDVDEILVSANTASLKTSESYDRFELIRTKKADGKNEDPNYIVNDFVYMLNGVVTTSQATKDTIAYYTYNVRLFEPDRENPLYLTNGQLTTTPSEFIIKYNADGSVALFDSYTTTGNESFVNSGKANNAATFYGSFIKNSTDNALNDKKNLDKKPWEWSAYYDLAAVANKMVKTFMLPEKVNGTLNAVPQTTAFENEFGYVNMNTDAAGILKPAESMTFKLDTVDTDTNVPSFYISNEGKFLYFAKDSADTYRLTNFKKYAFYIDDAEYARLIFKSAELANSDTLKTIVDGKLVSVAEKRDANKGVKGGLNNFKFQVIESGDGDDTYVIRNNAQGKYIANFNGNLYLGSNINGAARFIVDPTETVANEAISTSSIKVVATNGAVIVKGATGKKVAISNVLGQTIANTVITSDEATIAAPAGVVVVAVEGEAAVKAIVK